MIPRNTPQPMQDVPILQWASGHTQARLGAHSRFQPFVGFHVERGKDAGLDGLLTAAHTPVIDIRHPRPGGSEIKAHWSLGEALRLYVVTAGPPATSVAHCLRTPATADAGIGLVWPAGEKSRMAVRVLLLLGETPVLLQLSVRSTMTNHLLAALVDHARICAAADDCIDRAKHPEVVCFHELALPLVAGTEVSAGRNGETAQIVPFVSDHPETVDKAYVSSCWRRNAVQQAAYAAWEGIRAWAIGYGSGEVTGDSQIEG